MTFFRPATLTLSITTANFRVDINAWQQIEAVARDPKNPASLDAFALLAQEKALRPMTPLTANASLSLGQTFTILNKATTGPIFGTFAGIRRSKGSVDARSQPTSATELGDKFSLELQLHRRRWEERRCAHGSERGPGTEHMAIEVRARQDPSLTDRRASFHAASQTGGNLRRKRATPMRRSGLERKITRQRRSVASGSRATTPGLFPATLTQFVFLPVAQAQTATAASNEWQRAREMAQAQTIAAEIAQLWPDDAAAHNQDAYLQLLLGASDGVAEAAERDADVLVRMEPRNWLARATLGLARLRLGRNKEALAAIRDLRVTGVEPPGPLAVRAAILAANGYEEGARNDARILGAKPLLPEERALIAPILR